jgi:two-component system response regulator RegA
LTRKERARYRSEKVVGMGVRTVLVVDDDVKLLNAYQRGFASANVRVFAVANSTDARRVAKMERPDLAVVDLRLGKEWGIDLLEYLRAEQPEMKLVLVSGLVSVASTAAAMRAGADHVLMKPVTASKILCELDATPAQVDPELERPPSLARLEYEHIVRTLDEVAGNISEAARRLGIRRQSLQRKLKKQPPQS